MTEMEAYWECLADLKESRSFDKCLDVVKELMVKSVDRNALGRAVEKAVLDNTDKETFAKITRDAIANKSNGDEYTEMEYQFYMDVCPEDFRFGIESEPTILS